MTYGSPRLPKLLTATCLVLAAAVLGGCKNDADGVSSAKPQAVETITIALEPAARSWSYAGLVKPRYQSDLGFRVGGKIIERVVDVGREVKSGDVIARLDPRDFEIAIEGQAAEMKAATIARDEATAALERYRVLFNDGHVSKAAFDQRVAAEAEAKSRLERAEHNLELARNQLAYTTLVSDTDGIVSMLPVEKGQVVTTGQLIARVARRDELEVEAALPERDVEAVRNAEAEVEIWGEGRLLPVVVREISPDADPSRARSAPALLCRQDRSRPSSAARRRCISKSRRRAKSQPYHCRPSLTTARVRSPGSCRATARGPRRDR